LHDIHDVNRIGRVFIILQWKNNMKKTNDLLDTYNATQINATNEP